MLKLKSGIQCFTYQNVDGNVIDIFSEMLTPSEINTFNTNCRVAVDSSTIIVTEEDINKLFKFKSEEDLGADNLSEVLEWVN
jgi:hypothetical protein